MRAEFRQVSKSYNGHRALDGLTMDAPAGEVYGLVGPNGARKTTAMQCLAGDLKPDSGEVLADGEPVFENPAVKGRIICLPDELCPFSKALTSVLMRFFLLLYLG